MWTWVAAFLALTLVLASDGVEAALHFNGEAIDGPFQIYNALRRIDAGQRGGVGFQFFHGIGIPYLHYLPYRLFGGDFAASEVTRQLIAILIGPALLLLTFRAFTRDWSKTFALSSLVLAFMVAAGLRPLFLAINSLVSIRSSVAMLVPVTVLARLSPRRRSVLTGIAMGASILLGTEQGLAVIMAFTLVTLLVAVRTRQWRDEIEALGIALLTTAAVYTLFVGLVGGADGIRGAFRYNFKLIPMDQYWYFGVPPNDFIGSWGRLVPRLTAKPTILISLLLGAAVTGLYLRRLWRRAATVAPADRALTVMLLYGMLACASLLGIFLVTYVEPLIRCLFIVAVLRVSQLIDAREAKPPDHRAHAFITMPRIGVLALAAVVLALLQARLLVRYVLQPPHILTAHVLGRQGQQLARSWTETIAAGQQVMDAHRRPDGRPPVLWSTYAGLLEARNGEFQPSTDYIIHVIGPENRRAYVEDFRRVQPTLVQTVLPTYSIYEIWIEQTSWDFYREVLRRYRVVARTPWSILWERKPADGPELREIWRGPVGPARAVDVPVPARAGSARRALLLEVEVSYHVKNPLQILPIVGAVPRYLVLESGTMTKAPITLDPYASRQRFPVLALEGATAHFEFQTYSLLPGAGIAVDSISVKEIPQTADMYPWMLDLGCSVTAECMGSAPSVRPP